MAGHEFRRVYRQCVDQANQVARGNAASYPTRRLWVATSLDLKRQGRLGREKMELSEENLLVEEMG